jgi:thiamine monophosphate kinase
VWPVRSPAVLEREQRKADSAKRRNERAGQKAAGVNAPDLAAVGAGDDLK